MSSLLVTFLFWLLILECFPSSCWMFFCTFDLTLTSLIIPIPCFFDCISVQIYRAPAEPLTFSFGADVLLLQYPKIKAKLLDQNKGFKSCQDLDRFHSWQGISFSFFQQKAISRCLKLSCLLLLTGAYKNFDGEGAFCTEWDHQGLSQLLLVPNQKGSE